VLGLALGGGVCLRPHKKLVKIEIEIGSDSRSGVAHFLDGEGFSLTCGAGSFQRSHAALNSVQLSRSSAGTAGAGESVETGRRLKVRESMADKAAPAVVQPRLRQVFHESWSINFKSNLLSECFSS
jgi:hypothetical protein